jgi:hypothetical protein
MGKVLAAFEELGKPILWGMGWVNRRLGSFGGHPVTPIRELNLGKDDFWCALSHLQRPV